jgi:hypothetical protein
LRIQIKKFIVLILKFSARVLASCIRRWRWVDVEPFYEIFKKYDFYFLPKHYFLPIPDDDDMKFACESELVGINMRDDFQMEFTHAVVLKYKSEFDTFPEYESNNNRLQYFMINGTFMTGDGHAYYSLIRDIKPATIIEIGSGQSTLLANHAIDKNFEECTKDTCQLKVIDPYCAYKLEKLKRLTELKNCKLQEVGLNYFHQLKSGDILFIDSSHTLKSGGDVWMEYCEIIPRLNSGVYVHIHDISLPMPYSTSYYHSHWYWNEQYVLQTLLTNNDKLEVVWAGNYLFHKYPKEMTTAFSPGYDMMRKIYPQAGPCSFWIRVK